MSVKPVSFKSILVFTIKDGKPKADVPSLTRATFEYNNQLKKYNLQDTFEHEEKLDGTVHNATKNFAIELDKKHRPAMLRADKRVFMTAADFYVNPRETEKRYFLTAATNEQEREILNVLNKGAVLYAVMFN